MTVSQQPPQVKGFFSGRHLLLLSARDPTQPSPAPLLGVVFAKPKNVGFKAKQDGVWNRAEDICCLDSGTVLGRVSNHVGAAGTAVPGRCDPGAACLFCYL
ncbi:hypothetical protein PoB_005783100 [Plakobranchus ocellatus]|uniref:Uncharacterized protein n=1 Tax=Plakobranchus ocellatus TaxID=259542 RepID=A0AAV4CEX8_9GAST|nr:hypothetical protein PoB_005783100 [Plakobranchus ocellatus]